MRRTIARIENRIEPPFETTGLVIGEVADTTSEGLPLVRWRAAPQEPCLARVVWMKPSPVWTACLGLRVVIGFEQGDQTKPIVLGLLDQPPEPDASSTDIPIEQEARSDHKPKTLRIDSEQELILECGKAKIALRADGRVLILGGHVVSRSTGVNKVRGGSVQIN